MKSTMRLDAEVDINFPVMNLDGDMGSTFWSSFQCPFFAIMA